MSELDNQMSELDNPYNIFTNIQFSILNMKMEDKINLLNDCFLVLNDLQKKEPKLRQTINSFIQKESCVLDDDSMKLLKYEFDTFKINSNNFLTSIQSGGKKIKGGAGELVPVNNQDVVPTPAKVIEVAPPSQPINGLSTFVSGLPSGLTPEQTAALLNKYLDVMQTTANADNTRALATIKTAETGLVIANQEKNNQTFINNLTISSVLFSYTAPAALLYYLNSTLNTVAIGTINLAGSAVSNVSGAAELTVRNAVPTILNGIIVSGRAVKDILPESVTDFLRSMVSTVKSTGVTDYATESVIGTAAQEFTSVGAEVGSETIIIGCIVFYIILVLVLSILTSLIVHLQTNRKFKAYIGFPGVGGISMGYGGKKTRKTRKNNRKINRKKTYRK